LASQLAMAIDHLNTPRGSIDAVNFLKVPQKFLPPPRAPRCPEHKSSGGLDAQQRNGSSATPMDPCQTHSSHSRSPQLPQLVWLRIPKDDTHKSRKERYSKIDNLAFSIVTSARRLCSYFQAHTIRILTDQPLRKGLHKLNTSERLIQWSVY
jgi:hypothetical protein